MKNRAICIAVLSAVLAANAPNASAQDDPATIAARARFKEGVDAYDKGQFEAARLSFQQAYAIKKHPAVLLNLAQSSVKSGHALDAATYFKQYIKEVPTATTQQRADAEKGLEEARKQLGRIEVVAPSGTEITLDDNNRLGSTPFPEAIDVEPGPHALKSTAETVRVTATAGQKVQAKFGVNAAVPSVVIPPPTVAQNNPPPGTPPDPGGADTGPTKKRSALPDNMTPAYVGFGVGAAGFISAIVFALFKGDAQSKADSVASDIRAAAQQRNLSPTGVCSSTTPSVQTAFSNACTTLKDDNSKVDTDAAVANVSLVVGIVGAAFGGAWILLGPRSEHSAQIRILPYAGYGNAGMIVGGSF